MPGRKLCQRGGAARVPLLLRGVTRVLAFSEWRTGATVEAAGSVSPSSLRSVAVAVLSGQLALPSALECCDSAAAAYPPANRREMLNRVWLLRRMRFTTE